MFTLFDISVHIKNPCYHTNIHTRHTYIRVCLYIGILSINPFFVGTKRTRLFLLHTHIKIFFLDFFIISKKI